MLLPLIAITAVAVATLAVETSAHVQPSQDGSAGSRLRVGQAGYLPSSPKHAVAVVRETPVTRADVHDADGRKVLSVTPAPPAENPDTAEQVQLIDVSALDRPGTYRLVLPETGESAELVVDPDALQRPLYLAMRSFYGQRCGIAVSLAPDFPEYSYPACHTQRSPYHESAGKAGERDATGGWHDAGDYGKYVVNSNITVGTLLWAWELFDDVLRPLSLNIPESGGPLPDVLAEVKWNLDWMLRMQDDDGGVFHKATTARFPGMVLPQADTAPVLVIGLGRDPWKTTAATAGFAAVGAIAARVYAPFDPAYARRWLDAAERAWAWALAYPDAHFRNNPPGISTGPYADGDASDELLWAAAELYRTTGKPAYREHFHTHHRRWQPTLRDGAPHGWPNLSNLGMYAYALTPTADPDIAGRIRRDALAAADALVARAASHGYRVPMRPSDYHWGSNSVLLNYLMMVQLAAVFEPKPAYHHAALDALHYVFGRNTFDTSFVTHVGRRWPMRPHHRPSAADGNDQPWPGLIVGGPNARDFNRGRAEPVPPGRAWVDRTDSYTTNENAINWNAPLVFVLAGALHHAVHSGR